MECKNGGKGLHLGPVPPGWASLEEFASAPANMTMFENGLDPLLLLILLRLMARFPLRQCSD